MAKIEEVPERLARSEVFNNTRERFIECTA